MNNSFLPCPARIERVEPLAPGHRLFTFYPERPLSLAPGQFVEVSLPGIGAFPVSACDLVRDGRIISCVRRAGRVTDALFRMEAGAVVGLRGPFGNGFPLAAFSDQEDALLVAGGLGMAPLMALLQALLDTHDRSGRIILLYGAREPDAVLFRKELADLAAAGRIVLRLSVDFAEEFPCRELDIVCEVGLVTDLLDDVTLDPGRTVAALCGPPALYRRMLDGLAGAGIPPQRIFATLERRMRCGVGTCCHCVTGGVFLCQEGPVFSLERLRTMEGAI
jgi:NAD(P)H-flavin reductase